MNVAAGPALVTGMSAGAGVVAPGSERGEQDASAAARSSAAVAWGARRGEGHPAPGWLASGRSASVMRTAPP
jgi:hypothetical protein